MIRPLDAQVMVNRTLDVQKLQGNAMQVLEDEDQILKERLDNQIKKAEQSVRRQSETVHGRLQDEGKHREADAHQGKKRERKETTVREKGNKTNRHEWRGRFIDLEL